MRKFRPYQSPFKQLSQIIPPLRSLRKAYYTINLFDDPLSPLGKDPRERSSSYMLGGLNPLVAMRKDVIDTFKPYKSWFHVIRDVVQPIRGVGNIIRGIFNLAVSPFLFMINTFHYAFHAITGKNFNYFLNHMGRNTVVTIGGMLGGVTSLIRGVSQIITTPAAWLRIPFRGIITAVRGRPTIADDLKKEAERTAVLINKNGKTLRDVVAIDSSIARCYRKLLIGIERGQAPGINREEFEASYHQAPRFTAISFDHRYHVNDSSSDRTQALRFLNLLTDKTPVNQSVNNKGELPLASNRTVGKSYNK